MGRMLPLALIASIALAAQAPPAGAALPRAEAVFTLPDMRGLIEGIAFRPKTGAYYFGDVHLRCVWLRRLRDERCREDDGREAERHQGPSGEER